MVFTTALNIGDAGWFMKDNRAESALVADISVRQRSTEGGHSGSPSVRYGFRLFAAPRIEGHWTWLEMASDEVFASKEELLASL